MAKIKWGMMVVDGRGKLGGHVLSKNKAGSIVRTKVTPANPRTTFQQQVRGLLGSISAGWSGLSAAAIAAWNAASADWAKTNEFGDPVTLSGKALYQALNQNLLLVGAAAISVPPLKEDMPTNVLTAAAVDTTAETITLTGAASSANYYIVLEATPIVPNGMENVTTKYRRIYSALSNAYVAADAYTALEDRFGTPTVAGKMFIRVKYIALNGQASTPQAVQAVVS